MNVERGVPLRATEFEVAVRATCDHCAEAQANPMPEGFDYTCCVPRALTLAGLAVALASEGESSARWRNEIRSEGVPDSARDQAERCMRSSGIWPWEHER